MADNPVQTNPTSIDPMFAIPPGATDLAYGDVSASAPSRVQEIDEYTGLPIFDSYVDADNNQPPSQSPNAALEVPDITSVISQTIRRSAGGYNVVDLIIEVDDVLGAENYEVRITKT